jgi:hypothetical protein
MVDIRTSCYAARLAAFSYPQKHWKALIFRGALQKFQSSAIHRLVELEVGRPHMMRVFGSE